MKFNRDDVSPDVLAHCKYWEVQVALTFPILPEDIEHRYEGDAEIDFARRALERVKPQLERLLKTSDFNGYYIRAVMARCRPWSPAKRVL